MFEIILFAARVALVALLFLFLLLVVRAGVGMAQGSRKSRKSKSLSVSITNGPAQLVGTTFTINSILLIGRAPGNDIQVSENSVSGSHARITPVQDGAVIEDLGSTNGTFLNGMAIHTPQSLRPGDHIEIGTLRMVVD